MDHNEAIARAYHAEAARLFKLAGDRKLKIDPAFSPENRAAYCLLEEKLGEDGMDVIALVKLAEMDPIEKLAFIGALGGLLARAGGALGKGLMGIGERIGLKTVGTAAANAAGAVEGGVASKIPSWFSGLAGKRGLTTPETGQLFGKMQAMGPMDFAKQRIFRKAVNAPMLEGGGAAAGAPAAATAAVKAKKGGLWPEVRSNLVMGGALGLTQRLFQNKEEDKPQVTYGY